MKSSLQFRYDETLDRSVNMQRRTRHGLQLVNGHGRKLFPQHEAAVDDVDDRMARIDTGYAADAGKREGASLDQFRFALLRALPGDDADRLGAMAEIPRAADGRHALRTAPTPQRRGVGTDGV